MNFMEIANARQSCRSYDPDRPVEPEKLQAILEAARLAPSACNGQPYHIHVFTGELATKVEEITTAGLFNRFATKAPMIILISGKPYVKSAAYGSQKTGLDYRSMDIGILVSYITAEAAAQGLGSCILGWIQNEKLQSATGITERIYLAITIGYSGPKDQHREKIRKDLEELVTIHE